jgi:cellulose 1,4-beta-cellobiosidase
MQLTIATLIAFAAGAIGAPADFVSPRQAPGGCSSAVQLDAKTNVWTSYTLHPNSFYRAEVEAAAAQMSSSDAAKALKVAEIGTFLWAYVKSLPRSRHRLIFKQ